jgi:hypothetical protein
MQVSVPLLLSYPALIASDSLSPQPRYGVDASPGEVTFQVVDQLWRQALDGSLAGDEVHARAEALLTLVNTQSPVVNWALTSSLALDMLEDFFDERLVCGLVTLRGSAAENGIALKS